MSRYLVDQIAAIDNIEVLTSTQVIEVTGDDRVEAVHLGNTVTGTEETRDASALFVFVGAVPHSAVVKDLVSMNDRGSSTPVRMFLPSQTRHESRDPYHLETSVPGVFAAGDVREGAVRRVASAVGEGSVAVTFVHRYLASV